MTYLVGTYEHQNLGTIVRNMSYIAHDVASIFCSFVPCIGHGSFKRLCLKDKHDTIIASRYDSPTRSALDETKHTAALAIASVAS